MTFTEIAAAIARLERLRASGVLSQTVDGTTTAFRSMDELDREIARLKREQLIVTGYEVPHPYATETF